MDGHIPRGSGGANSGRDADSATGRLGSDTAANVDGATGALGAADTMRVARGDVDAAAAATSFVAPTPRTECDVTAGRVGRAGIAAADGDTATIANSALTDLKVDVATGTTRCRTSSQRQRAGAATARTAGVDVQTTRDAPGACSGGAQGHRAAVQHGASTGANHDAATAAACVSGGAALDDEVATVAHVATAHKHGDIASMAADRFTSFNAHMPAVTGGGRTSLERDGPTDPSLASIGGEQANAAARAELAGARCHQHAPTASTAREATKQLDVAAVVALHVAAEARAAHDLDSTTVAAISEVCGCTVASADEDAPTNSSLVRRVTTAENGVSAIPGVAGAYLKQDATTGATSGCAGTQAHRAAVAPAGRAGEQHDGPADTLRTRVGRAQRDGATGGLGAVAGLDVDVATSTCVSGATTLQGDVASLADVAFSSTDRHVAGLTALGIAGHQRHVPGVTHAGRAGGQRDGAGSAHGASVGSVHEDVAAGRAHTGTSGEPQVTTVAFVRGTTLHHDIAAHIATVRALSSTAEDFHSAAVATVL